jgi:hypothetical protein
MSPEDPRHGTVAGHIAHQRGDRDYCDPCIRAKAMYDKRRKWAAYNGQGYTVASLGARRRLQALQALGWSRQRVAEAAGWPTTGALNYLMRNETITRATHDRLAAAYDALSMRTPPDEMAARRARTWARRRGYAPPLAWDDIDNDPAPNLGGRDDDVDPVVVMRLLEGQRVPSTKAEKDAAMAQWVADGGSKAELCRWHGWKQGRYGRLEVVA